MTENRTPEHVSRPVLQVSSVPTATTMPRRRPFRQRLQTLIRLLHVYSSLIGLTTILFFGVTGLTLNHPQWFDTGYHAVREESGTINGSLIVGNAAKEKKLEIVEFLRSKHGIHAALKDLQIDEYQIHVSFAGPAYTADVDIDRENASYQFTELRLGLTAIVNDLHKGRDSGPIWSILIDVSAVLMILVSISGTLLLVWLKRLWRSGLWSIIGGAGVFGTIVWWIVP